MKEQKDYNSISPSAEYLVRLKAFTTIPFAKEAATLLIHDTGELGSINPEHQNTKAFFRWLIHFENRYRTVENLLRNTHPQRILEISSGYSFRGLAWCFEQPVHFIDTDLPDLVAAKNKLIPLLAAGRNTPMKGVFELLPLNVMDTDRFTEVINHFGEGPVSIVNEGLLVYLGMEEKRQLCDTICQVLDQRGGDWITGDIYIRSETDETYAHHPEWDAFRKKHRLNENRFDSFAAAEAFFASCGLEVVERQALAPDDLSCLDLPGVNKHDILRLLAHKPHARESWRLRVRQ